MASKIKSGDTVYVISGDSKGEKGKVIKVNPKTGKVFVEGINVRKRNVRPSAKHPDGGVVEKMHGIHSSNVAIADPEAQESLHWSRCVTTRVGFRILPDGRKVRYAKRSKKELS